MSSRPFAQQSAPVTALTPLTERETTFHPAVTAKPAGTDQAVADPGPSGHHRSRGIVPRFPAGRYQRLCAAVISRLKGTDMILVPVQSIPAAVRADVAAVPAEEVLRHEYAARRRGRSPADGPG